jgi:hypothetical protein
MNLGVVTLAALLSVAAQAGPKRYEIAVDLSSFPQSTPQEALASLLKAAEANRFDYLVAHLADPDFVDDRVRRLYGGRFAEQVDDTRGRLDGRAQSLLGLFLKDGRWQITKGRATVTLKDVTDRTLSLRRIGERWYVQNQNK